METIGEVVLYKGSSYLVTPDYHKGVKWVRYERKVRLDNGEDRYEFSVVVPCHVGASLASDLMTEARVKQYVLPNKSGGSLVMEDWRKKNEI
jgi:hypothetical protein